jgi:phage shock protein A
MKITPFGKREQYDIQFSTRLMEMVAEEVATDAREKKDKIERLESAVLQRRTALVKLKQKYENLREDVRHLKKLADQLRKNEISASDAQQQLRTILENE